MEAPKALMLEQGIRVTTSSGETFSLNTERQWSSPQDRDTAGYR